MKSISSLHKITFVITFTIIASPLLFWLGFFYDYGLAKDSSKWADFGSFIGGTVTPILTLVSVLGLIWTIIEQRKQLNHSIEQAEIQRSEDAKDALAQRESELEQRQLEQSRRDNQVYKEEAQKSLLRAFEAFQPNSQLSPTENRLMWLTAARNIITAQNLSVKITEESLRESYDSFEEEVRTKFYSLLEPHELKGLLANFDFADIAPVSIAVVLRFAQEMKEEPLTKEHDFTDEELHRVGFRPELVRLKSTLSNFKQYKEKLDK